MKIREAFSIVIKRERTSQALTQEQVSTRGDLNITFLRDLEHARSSPTLETIFKIANGLGIEPYRLLLLTEQLLHQK